ncbi:DUF2793 domain-containing protein [Sandarakinorhabdus sp. AAP62]|uniref:DUF2793 domain-containing protein n=1 Tax=Sandarakinorhabdus sp. AAP62 TaxID=1248916 RepID=UPI0003039B45|nr:DUF2793 domain-containing protein [Sandarakinorhabdus sp. AAP62]
MPTTPRLALPLIAAGQAQKDVTHNEAVLALDRLVALEVNSRSLMVPPSAPQTGACYIVPAAGSVAWGHPAGTLLHWQGAAWLPETPRDGQIALLVDEGLMLIHRGNWRDLWPVAGLVVSGRAVLAVPPVSLAAPSGGAIIDSEARTVLTALLAALQQQGIIS